MAQKDILNLLEQGVVLSDGGNVEEARMRGYRTPRALVEFPHVVRLVHQDYFRAGAQALRAVTRGNTRTHLEKQGNWGSRVEEINRTAVRLAKEVAGDEAPVAGCVGPTGVFKAEDRASHDRARSEWEEQVAAMTKEGVDFLVCESFDRLDEARLALACCKKAGVPTMVTVDVLLREETTRDGASPATCARVLVDEGADGVGMSGSREPQDMWDVILGMREAVDVPIAFLPSGYRTSASGWESIREAMVIYGFEMARFALQAKVRGIHYIGGCDGAGPEIIRSVAQALDCERVHIGLRPRWIGDRW